LLAPGATVVLERSSRTPAPVWPEVFGDVRERRYGETSVWTARC
jgi:16S rRNA (guanine966-N2)-methyltransferase